MIVDPKTFTLSATAGAFIVFEGGNGVGKSTLLNQIADHLSVQKKDVVVTREPGGTLLGGAIRSLVKERKDIPIDERAELLLFCADRAQHVRELIKPALQKGQWVLSDRHYFSTIAFQGYGRGLSRPLIDQAVDLALDGSRPDLTVIVDLPIEEAKRRMHSRGQVTGEVDRFEEENDKFQQRVRNGFLALAKESPEPCIVLDGMKSIETLRDELLSVMKV